MIEIVCARLLPLPLLQGATCKLKPPDAFHAHLIQRRRFFPTNYEYGRHNLLTKTQKRVYSEPTVWAERHKRLWVTNIHSDATITIIATALTSVHTISKMTTLLTGRGEALRCHLSRAKSSSATRRTRPSTSEGAEEHGVHVSQRARLIPPVQWGSGLGSRAALRRHGGS